MTNTHKKRTFEDVAIVHDGITECDTFVPQLCTMLRTQTNFYTPITWTENSKFVFTNNGAALTKIEHDGWDNVIHSTQPLTNPISYFQMKVNHLSDTKVNGGGLFFGVSKTNKVGYCDYFETSKCVCIYNDAASLGSSSVKLQRPCTTVAGDVIGVVVDTKLDFIKFYINGSLVATGNNKPSLLQPLYASAWTYYKNCHLTMGDYIPYGSLSDDK